MSESLTRTQFRTTKWSMVVRATGSAVELNELLREYWGPMYAYVRRSGCSREDAADVVQEFITERMLAGSLLSRADPERGRFRAFLKASLRNFLTDRARNEGAVKRSPRNGEIVQGEILDGFEPLNEDDPSSAFDRQWVATLLSRTLSLVRAECEAEGQERHWQAFERMLVSPALTGAAPAALAELAHELGADSARSVSSMVQTVRRKFHRLLREVIEETLADAAEADAEFLELREFLGLSSL